ncbi:MAG: hypothetical protein ACR2GY_12145 [Phycisphaerales bacterium]
MLINDVDLLRLDPSLFTAAASLATVLASGSDGAVAATALSSASSDFATLSIDDGHVIVIAGTPCEVTQRTSATGLDVALPRSSDAGTAVGPGDGSALAFSVLSFERQIAQQEMWVLGALGIDADHPGTPLDETAIIDTEPVRSMIAHRVLASVYEAASAGDTADASLAQRAVLARRNATDAMSRTVAWLDIDGDGVPDATRRIDVVIFARA